MEEKKYLYSVKPRRTIKGVAGIAAIRTAKSLFLTKEEVLQCVKDATVYRRFSADKSEQVTPFKLDRLHRDEYLTEKEYKELLANEQGSERGTTKEIIPTVDSKEAKVDETRDQGSPASTEVKDASENNSEEIEHVADDTKTSISDDDQVKATNDKEEKEVDADDHSSESSETTTVDNEFSVSTESEDENVAKFAQVSRDQVADDKPHFQTSSIQVNTSGKKKNKNKH